MENAIQIFVVFIFLIAIILVVLKRIIEPAYMVVFKRPLFVHFYLWPRRLTQEQRRLLEKNFAFYRNLSPVRKGYFQHRVHNFINTYEFQGREGLQVSNEMKILIAATSVMLTFGLGNYLSGLFTTIIIYPDIFESVDGTYHKGEFNRGGGYVIFSWKHFLEGIAYDNDNLNLGLHEFAHVLHFESARSSTEASAVIYTDMFNEIRAYLADAKKMEHIESIGYFRGYAYTNLFEFIAVALEHFFESPREFQQKLPELYGMVRQMINFTDK